MLLNSKVLSVVNLLLLVFDWCWSKSSKTKHYKGPKIARQERVRILFANALECILINFVVK